jgi:phage shock protein A
MKILDRLSRLVRADAHGFMDQLEERSLLLKQHLREAELELTHKRACQEAMEEECLRLADEVQGAEKEIALLDQDVELAMSEGREELARFAIRKLIPRRASVARMHERIGELRQSQARLGEKLQAQEAQFSELRTRVRARLSELRCREEASPFVEPMVDDEDIELELLRRRTEPSATDTGEEIRS